MNNKKEQNLKKEVNKKEFILENVDFSKIEEGKKQKVSLERIKKGLLFKKEKE